MGIGVAEVPDRAIDKRVTSKDVWRPTRFQQGLFLALLTLLSSYPFLRSSVSLGHDVMFHLLRIESIARGLAQGILPVRLYQAQAFGLGYPCGVCYPDTFLYAPALLRCLGLSLKSSYVAFILMVNAATAGIGLYSFKRMFRSDSVAMTCTTLWTLAPYRLCNIMVRASVGEYLALMFAPLLALGVWAVLDADEWKQGWIWLGLACAGIAQSHLLSVLLFAIIGLPFVIALFVKGRARHKVINLIKAFALATLLSLWFVIPFLSFYTQHALKVGGSVEDTFSWSLEPAQVLAPFLRFAGGSNQLGGSLEKEMPLGLGWSLLMALPLLAVSFDGRIKADGENARGRYRWYATIIAVMIGVSVLLTTYLFPWYKQYDGGLIGAVVAKLAVIQFSWRFLGQASFLLVLLWGVLLLQRSDRPMRLMAVIGLCLCLVEAGYATSSYVRYALTKSEPELMAEAGMEIGAGEYLPAGMELDDVKAREDGQPIVTSGTAVVRSSEWTCAQTYTISYANESTEASTISLPVLWCKLFEVQGTTDAGEAIQPTIGERDGFVELAVEPQQSATVTVRFSEPFLWRAAEIVSLVCALGLVAGVVRAHRAPKDAKRSVA